MSTMDVGLILLSLSMVLIVVIIIATAGPGQLNTLLAIAQTIVAAMAGGRAVWLIGWGR